MKLWKSSPSDSALKHLLLTNSREITMHTEIQAPVNGNGAIHLPHEHKPAKKARRVMHTPEKKTEGPKYSYEAECIRAFLASVTLLDGCCYCTMKGKPVHRGRAAIERLACWLSDDTKKPPTIADCADMLNFLANLQPIARSSCHFCDQEEAAVGFNEVLDFVRDSMLEHIKAEAGKKQSPKKTDNAVN